MNRFVLCALVTGSMASASWSASIGLFATPDYSSCNLTIHPGGTGTFYVVAMDATGPILCGPGLGGVHLRIAGLPAGWTAAAEPSPASTSSAGDPFGVYSALGFDPPQMGDLILLYTVTLARDGSDSSALLQVTVTNDAIGDSYGCPLRSGPGDCLADFDVACVDGGTLYVNMPGDCVVAVQTGTWSLVKRLYE